MAASFKPAYLSQATITVGLGERRARLRALADRVSGSQGIEVFEGDAAAVEGVAAALSAMTFAIGRRFLIVADVGAGRPPT